MSEIPARLAVDADARIRDPNELLAVDNDERDLVTLEQGSLDTRGHVALAVEHHELPGVEANHRARRRHRHTMMRPRVRRVGYLVEARPIVVPLPTRRYRRILAHWRILAPGWASGLGR